MSENGGNSWGDLWDDPCGVSDCFSGVGTSGPVVPVVTDVPVSPSFVVTEFCDAFSLRSDGVLVEPQPFFSQQRAHSWTVTQEEMRCESSSARTPPPSRRRVMPPTPLQISHSLYEERQKLSNTWKTVIA